MSKGTVNKVIILGRLGADPEVRYMPNGTAIANLRLATNDGYKDKQTGQFVESTEWHKVVLFGRLGEIAGEYLRKGGMVYIEGRLRTNKWQDQNGQDRYTTEIVASEMQLLGGRAGEPGAQAHSGGGQEAQTAQSTQTAPAAPRASKPKPQAPATGGAGNFEQPFDDDEIPF